MNRKVLFAGTIAVLGTCAATLLPTIAAQADDRCVVPGPVAYYRDGDRHARFVETERFRHDAPREVVVVRPREGYVDGYRAPIVVEPRDGYVDGYRAPIVVEPRDGFRDRFVTYRQPNAVVQENKNNDRNIATLGVAAAAVGLLTHNNALTTIGAVGAVVGGSAYEHERNVQEVRDARGW